MRVLQLVTNGGARFFEQQTEALESRGIECTTLSLSSKTQQDADQTRSVGTYFELYPKVLKRSFDSYDLVHANYGLTAPHALAQPNLPVVLSLWGSDLMGPAGPVSKFCAQYCDAVIVMSERMADELDCDCYVIPHGVDLERFQPGSEREAKAELGWDPEKKHVLFPYASEREVKNFPRAERVAAAADERVDADVELHQVYGIPHERVAVHMNAADALLITSEREGSPNTVKEALACNTPIVSTDVGDVPERLDGVNRSHVGRTDRELVDALVDVLVTDEASDGRKEAEEISLERMGERIAGVYRDVLENR